MLLISSSSASHTSFLDLPWLSLQKTLSRCPIPRNPEYCLKEVLLLNMMVRESSTFFKATRMCFAKSNLYSGFPLQLLIFKNYVKVGLSEDKNTNNENWCHYRVFWGWLGIFEHDICLQNRGEEQDTSLILAHHMKIGLLLFWIGALTDHMCWPCTLEVIIVIIKPWSFSNFNWPSFFLEMLKTLQKQRPV